MLRRARASVACCASLFVFGCSDSLPVAKQVDASPVTLEPFSTLTLVETDSAFIGMANALAVSTSGDIFVTDLHSNRVFRFDSRGLFRETIGRQGHGPDEFAGPGLLTSIDDSTLLVVDHSRRDAVLWDVRLGAARQRFGVTGAPGRFAFSNGWLYVGAPDITHGTLGLKWELGSDSARYVGKIRPAYEGRLANVWGHVAVTVRSDTLFYYPGNSDYLVSADSNWNDIDSIFVPRRERRGIPQDLDTRLGGGRDVYTLMNQVSIPVQIDGLSGSRIAVTHLDATVSNNLVTGQVFVTVVSRETAPRCIDVAVPMRDSLTIARVSFIGDTLFVFDQFLDGKKVVAQISKYLLSPEVC